MTVRTLACAASVLLASAVAGAQQRGDAQAPGAQGARYTALAINLDAPSGSVATPVDILIERWSTDAERDMVMDGILEAGQNRLLSILQKLPRIGSIRTAGSIGWDLRYARRGAGTDGRERVMILTDRPIAFWEVRNQARSMEYPITIIDLRIGSNNRGEGQLVLGAKINADRGTQTIIIENIATQPISLNDVRREK